MLGATLALVLLTLGVVEALPGDVVADTDSKDFPLLCRAPNVIEVCGDVDSPATRAGCEFRCNIVDGATVSCPNPDAVLVFKQLMEQVREGAYTCFWRGTSVNEA